MDKKIVNLINDNLDELVANTNDLNVILNKLQELGVLNIHMINYLNKFTDHKGKATAFYKLIQGRGPMAFQHLMHTLRTTENCQAENILSSFRILGVIPPRPSTIDTNSGLFDTLDEIDDSKNEADADNDEEFVVKIHPERQFMDTDEEKKAPYATYRMRSKPRGHVLIINILNTKGFDKKRSGSEKDLKRLNKLFTDLGFEVETHQDLRQKEFKKAVEKFSRNEKLRKVDCSVVFIMCHGQNSKDNSVELIAADGEPVGTNWIIQQFNFSPLTSDGQRKPKLFIFQACRIGKEQQCNIIYGKKLIATDSKSRFEMQETQRKIEDNIIINSTIPGYVSMRDSEDGAWFVKLFCKIIAEHAWQHDLYSMFLMIDEEICKKKSSEHGYQTPELSNQGVGKRLYFNPGLYEP